MSSSWSAVFRALTKMLYLRASPKVGISIEVESSKTITLEDPVSEG